MLQVSTNLQQKRTEVNKLTVDKNTQAEPAQKTLMVGGTHSSIVNINKTSDVWCQIVVFRLVIFFNFCQ